jgi:arylformamidase
MIVRLTHHGKDYTIDLADPLDITMTLDPSTSTPKCFYAPDLTVTPVIAGTWIGDIERGSVVNFKNLAINPHGNGTHTECVGHILAGDYTMDRALTQKHYIAHLISVVPTPITQDLVISLESIRHKIADLSPAHAIVIRTLPNTIGKITTDYSGQNPPYIEARAIEFLVQKGYQHLLVDLPSVDREEDGGALAAHKAWWAVDQDHFDPYRTITELLYVDDAISDGLYLCQISPIKLKSDAAPSTVILYKMKED